MPQVSVGGLVQVAQDVCGLLDEEALCLHSNVGQTQTAMLEGVLQLGQGVSHVCSYI